MNLDIHISNLKCFEPYLDTNTIFQIASDYEHTMANSLYTYVENKIHSSCNQYAHFTFNTTYKREDTEVIKSTNEKTDKFFNWQRPTLDKNKSDYYIFPGQDYLTHYSLLYNYWINKLRKHTPLQNPNHIKVNRVNFNQIWNSLNIPTKLKNTVILGYVEPIRNLNYDSWTEFKNNNQFAYAHHTSSSVSLLGCYHSYWGDISGVLVYKLAAYGVKNILYVGKLGSLISKLKPNTDLITGDISYLQGKLINWSGNNLCKKLELPKVRHYSLPSTMLETKAWAIKARTEFDVVDPEIGHMAQQSLQCGINFGYIHLVTDYLLNEDNNEGLHNEREFDSKRKKVFLQLKQHLYNLPIW